MKKKTWFIVYIVATSLFIFLMYYLTLPALNFGSVGFYFFLALVVAFGLSIYFIKRVPYLREKNKGMTYKRRYLDRNGTSHVKIIDADTKFNGVIQSLKAYVITFGSVVVLILLFLIIGSKLFSSRAYYNQLPYQESTEEELVETFDIDDGKVLLPNIDKELAYKLAQGSLEEYGAQYTIDPDKFTLLSIKENGVDKLVRIAPLEYSNVFVALAKKNEGSIGYIQVDVVTKEVKLVKVEGGIKYMPSGVFGKDISRHIRFKYPTVLFNELNFEIDDNGKPYWIIPIHKKSIGVLNGPKQTGVIVLDPVTGDMEKYELGKEPSWIDRAINEQIISKQATNRLRYKNGFFNVHFGEKKEVFQLSDGYNYFIKDGNTYYVSSITSPNEGDQTSIGFMAINLKTGVATRYNFSGITEMRAREIAMNDASVKAQQLDATWPILISYRGVETYFIVLKNSVKEQYVVFVKVADGELAMGATLQDAKTEYDRLLASSDVTENDLKVTGTIDRVRDLGDTIEFTLVGSDKYFVVNPTISTDARFMQSGDIVNISYKDFEDYYYVTEYKKQ